MKKILTLFLSVCLFMSAKAQDMQVSGKVTQASDGSPLPGVTVLVKGTAAGTATDANGDFKIMCAKDASLVFSFIGMTTKEMAVAGLPLMNIALSEEKSNLNDVVVTAIGIKKEKRSVGYATQQVTGDDLTRGQNLSPISSLQGKVSGVNITTGSNMAGGSTRIVLRGGSSLTGDNQPLIIIDGVPINNANNLTSDALNNQVDYGNRGNDINPDDIENISVLKGPAAAALYGQNASNGAIIITTKHGAKQLKGAGKKITVTYNTSLGFQSVLKLPTYQNQFGEGDIDNLKDDRRENFSWGLPFDDHSRPWGQVINGKQQIKPYSALPNNVKDFFDIGKMWTNNLSFTGGNAKSTYYLAINSTNNKGVIPTTTYDKYGIRFNASTEFTDKLTGNINFNYSNINSSVATTGQGDNSFLNNIQQTPRDISLLDIKDLTDPFNAMVVKTDSGNFYGYYGGYTANPWFQLENMKNTNTVDRMMGSFSMSYKPAENWEIIERVGVDWYNDRRYQKWLKYNTNPFEDFYDGLYNGLPHTFAGKYSEDVYNYKQINHDLMVTYTHKLTDDIDFKALVGQNYNEVIQNHLFASTNESGGLVIEDNFNLDNSNGPAVTKNTFTNRRLAAVYASGDLSYKNYLYLNLTARNDWSSTLPESHRSFVYPSGNLSFIFSELLNKKITEKYLSYGKIRMGAASVGHDASPYSLTTVYNKTEISGGYGKTIFPFNSVPGYSYSSILRDPNLEPEKTNSFEIGTELSFLKDRLGVDFTWFTANNINQIIDAPVAPSTGFDAKTINVGKMSNKGIELLVKGTPIAYKGFRWDLTATYTKTNNKVVSLLAGTDQITLGGTSGMSVVAAVGKPYGTFYAIDNLKNDAGQTVVDSLTGLPLHTPNPVYKGSYLPNYLASFRSTMSYKGFYLSILFDTKQGGYFYSRTKDVLGFVGASEETAFNNREDYVFDNSVYKNYKGDYVTNTTKMHPYTYYTDAGTGIPVGQHIVDASYIKLRELAFYYDIPEKCIGKTPFASAMIGVFANNLFLWTPKANKYADPEINSEGASNTQGFEFTAAPSIRNYGVNLKLTF